MSSKGTHCVTYNCTVNQCHISKLGDINSEQYWILKNGKPFPTLQLGIVSPNFIPHQNIPLNLGTLCSYFQSND